MNRTQKKLMAQGFKVVQTLRGSNTIDGCTSDWAEQLWKKGKECRTMVYSSEWAICDVLKGNQLGKTRRKYS